MTDERSTTKVQYGDQQRAGGNAYYDLVSNSATLISILTTGDSFTSNLSDEQLLIERFFFSLEHKLNLSPVPSPGGLEWDKQTYM
jgi:hypothetical protein